MTTKPVSEETAQLPPGDLGLPFIGSTFQMLSNKDFIEELYRENGNIFKTRIFGARTIIVVGGENIQYVLSNENKNFQAHPLGNMRKLFGEYSLSLQTGEVHQSRRRILKAAFSSRKILAYQETIQSITDSYINKWKRKSEFKLYPELKKYTLDIACKFLIGIDNGSETEIGRYFENWCEGFFSFSPSLPFTKTKRAFDGRRKLLNAFDEIIQERE